MEERILVRLREIVGSEYVRTGRDELLCHSCDATRRTSLPEAVVHPVSVEQVAAVSRLCSEEGIPLTPRGAGTGLSGGAIPLSGGVSLSLTRMNRIKEIVSEDLYAVVEAGMVTEELQKAIEAMSLFYPPDPTSRSRSTIGGNVAASAGGLRSLKYGVTKNYLMGLEIVLPTGEVMKTGARTVKSVAGYDLTRLICGSEGTLAIVTSATLKLIPLPEHRVTVLAAFQTLEKAAAACWNALAIGIAPSSLEIMDSLAVRTAGMEMVLPTGSGESSLILAETDGFRDAAEDEADRLGRAFGGSGALLVEKEVESGIAEGLWKARRDVLTGLAGLKPVTVLNDVTVPRSRLVEMARSITDIGNRHGLTVATFGHAGEGNLHPTILADASAQEKGSGIRAAVSEISEAAISFGGTVSGVYGIGTEKADFVRSGIAEPALEAMKRLKDAFDPKGILNPGKLLAGR